MKEFQIEDFGAELQRLMTETIKNVEVGVNEIAEDLGATSQKLAPLDEAGLMENATIEPAINTSGEIKAVVGYNKEYALKMHEDFYNLGATSAGKSGFDGMSVGRKYLAQPVTQYKEKYMKHIVEKMSDTT